MTKARNNKAGFTLIEMVLVVAIITILSTVLVSGLVAYIQLSNERAGKVTEHANRYVQANANVDLQLKTSYTDIKNWKDPNDTSSSSSGSTGAAVLGGGSTSTGSEGSGGSGGSGGSEGTPEATEATEATDRRQNHQNRRRQHCVEKREEIGHESK